jgi:hypothetical protein
MVPGSRLAPAAAGSIGPGFLSFHVFSLSPTRPYPSFVCFSWCWILWFSFRKKKKKTLPNEAQRRLIVLHSRISSTPVLQTSCPLIALVQWKSVSSYDLPGPVGLSYGIPYRITSSKYLVLHQHYCWSLDVQWHRVFVEFLFRHIYRLHFSRWIGVER